MRGGEGKEREGGGGGEFFLGGGVGGGACTNEIRQRGKRGLVGGWMGGWPTQSYLKRIPVLLLL